MLLSSTAVVVALTWVTFLSHRPFKRLAEDDEEHVTSGMSVRDPDVPLPAKPTPSQVFHEAENVFVVSCRHANGCHALLLRTMCWLSANRYRIPIGGVLYNVIRQLNVLVKAVDMAEIIRRFNKHC